MRIGASDQTAEPVGDIADGVCHLPGVDSELKAHRTAKPEGETGARGHLPLAVFALADGRFSLGTDPCPPLRRGTRPDTADIGTS